jgi:hypothetical protein
MCRSCHVRHGELAVAPAGDKTASQVGETAFQIIHDPVCCRRRHHQSPSSSAQTKKLHFIDPIHHSLARGKLDVADRVICCCSFVLFLFLATQEPLAGDGIWEERLIISHSSDDEAATHGGDAVTGVISSTAGTKVIDQSIDRFIYLSTSISFRFRLIPHQNRLFQL